VDAGRRLANLHINYESVDPYPLNEEIHGSFKHHDRELWRVIKMRWRSKTDHSAIIYNSHIIISGIPDQAHRYVLRSRTGLDWLIDQYRSRLTSPRAS
jgi:predicted helicase